MVLYASDACYTTASSSNLKPMSCFSKRSSMLWLRPDWVFSWCSYWSAVTTGMVGHSIRNRWVDLLPEIDNHACVSNISEACLIPLGSNSSRKWCRDAIWRSRDCGVWVRTDFAIYCLITAYPDATSIPTPVYTRPREKTMLSGLFQSFACQQAYNRLYNCFYLLIFPLLAIVLRILNSIVHLLPDVVPPKPNMNAAAVLHSKAHGRALSRWEHVWGRQSIYS